MSLRLHPDTGQVAGMGFRCRMQPPPDVPRNITQKQAEELGKECLTDRAVVGGSGIRVSGVNKVELKVVSPGRAMLPGKAHAAEPSRLAWVVEYDRGYGDPGYRHVAEAWIDIEDGSFLGGQFSG